VNYLFVSKDPYPKGKAIDELRDKLLDRDMVSLNLRTFHADTDSIEDVIAYARTLPFASRNRIAVIKNTDAFLKKDLEPLLEYFKNPSKHTTVIIDCDEDPGSTILWEHIKKNVKIMRFDNRDRDTFEKWIQQRIKQLDKKISREAVVLFKELVGSEDFILAENELDKVVAFIGVREDITREDIELLVGRKADEDIFKLVNTISQKMVKESLDIISDLLLRKIRPYEIIGLLGWHFRKMYFQSTYARMSKSELRNSIGLLLSTDRDIKRSRIDPKIALEIAVVKLCGDYRSPLFESL